VTREEIDAKLASCEQWGRWTPTQPRSLLGLALHDEGYYGGIEIRGVGRRKYQAIVIATNRCQWIEPGDVVAFDLGQSEELQTVNGQTFYWLTEEHCDGVDDEFFKPPEMHASGLWIAS
jgi:hypothetical protein